MTDKDGNPICPICYTKIGAGIESWTDDPLLTPNHFMLALRGNTLQRTRHITEIQDKINEYETQFGISPLTTWTPTDAGKYPYRAQHINELREAIEAILLSIGVLLTDWLSYDENSEPTLGITGWLGGSRLLSKVLIRGMHIEELRKQIKLIWENFEKEGSNIVSVIGDITTVIDAFYDLQKNQLWDGIVTASREYYNSVHYFTSTSNAIASISNTIESISGVGSGSSTANAKAYGGTAVHPVGFILGGASGSGADGFLIGTGLTPAEAYGLAQIRAIVPVIPDSGGITAFPCRKAIWNSITEVYDVYNLFIKADCVPIVQATGNSAESSDVIYFPACYSQAEKDAWTAKLVEQNPYHSGRAEVRLIVTTTRGTLLGGTAMIMVEGVYVQSDGYADLLPTGVPTNLNDFDIDLAQFLLDNFPLTNPDTEYITFVEMDSLCYGIANSYDIKGGELIETINGVWCGQTRLTGGYTNASASFTIDNIDLYYKKVVTP